MTFEECKQLLEQTHAGLAQFEVEALERCALHAEILFHQSSKNLSELQAVELQCRSKMLLELMLQTQQGIEVLRRMRGQENRPWVL